MDRDIFDSEEDKEFADLPKSAFTDGGDEPADSDEFMPEEIPDVVGEVEPEEEAV